MAGIGISGKVAQGAGMTYLNEIRIWEPRYHSRSVLIDPKKVREHNIITFTKGTYKGQKYYIRGQILKQYPLTSNGSILCHDVPMDKLEPLAKPEGER